MPEAIIDTHIHVWDLEAAAYPWLEGDTSLLNRTYSIKELEADRTRANVVAGVLVQASGNPEDTALMLEVARQTPWIKGVVGWLPLQDPEHVGKWLEENYRAEPYFKGVRHQIHDEPDVRWLLQPPVLESLKLLARHGLPYDLVGISDGHIETALKVADKVPGLRLVFDHLNQPPVQTREKFGKWGDLMKTAAENPDFHAKISGLGTVFGVGKWTPENVLPSIAFALETFGTDRCFCGGDWPVSLLAGGYRQTWETYGAVLAELLEAAEQEKVLYTNAKTFYSLEMEDTL